MLSFISYISLRNLFVSLLIWVPVVLLDVFEVRSGHSGYVALFGLVLVPSFIIAISNQTRWLSFLNRAADSIQDYWIWVLVVMVTNALVSFGIWFCYNKFYLDPMGLQVLNNFSVIEMICIVLSALTLSLLSVLDPKSIWQKNKGFWKSRLFGVILLWVYFAIVSVFFVYSRILGYAVLNILGLMYFTTQNEFIQSSLVSKYRVTLSLSVFICCLGFFGGAYMMARQDPKGYLGFISSKSQVAKFNAEQLRTIKTSAEWVKLVGQVHWEANEQVKTALLYLEHLCPLAPTDQPLDISCEDSAKTRVSATLPLALSEVEIGHWLNSPSVYVRLAATISARSLPKISPDLEKKIKKASQGSSRLSLVAEKTLTNLSPYKKQRILVQIN